MWDGFDKRKFPRLNLKCEILIRDESKSRPLKAITENVGAGGVAVILTQRLDRFSLCKINLELEPALPKIQGSGKIVWTIPVGELGSKKKKYDTGIEFTDLPDAKQDILKKFLESKISEGFQDLSAKG